MLPRVVRAPYTHTRNTLGAVGAVAARVHTYAFLSTLRSIYYLAGTKQRRRQQRKTYLSATGVNELYRSHGTKRV